MSRISKIFFVVIVLICKANGQQQVGEWRSFTDMKSVRSAMLHGTTIWAATSGGIFAYDTITNQFKKFTNVDGLDTNDTRTIIVDNKNRLWIGSSGGWINIYDLSTREWKTIRDIADKKEYTQRSIQSFYVKGDTVFIVTEFGISVFDISNWKFLDTYFSQNLDPASPSQITCMAVQSNRIWIGTINGLFSASLSNHISWLKYSTASGLPSNSITAFAVNDGSDTLIIGTNNGAAYFASNDSLPRNISSLNGRNIRQLQISTGKLFILSSSNSSFSIESLTSVSDFPIPIASNFETQGVSVIPASSIWIATASKGLAKNTTSNNWDYIYPNGPNSNLFNSLVVDANGVLWCAPGESGQAGFYRYNPALAEGEQWKSFTNGNYHKVSLGANGSVWASSWGDGMREVVSDKIQLRLSYDTKPTMPDAADNLKNVVVGGAVAVDEQGNTWITTRTNNINKGLLRLSSDADTIGQFVPNAYGYYNFHEVVIDRDGTKWIATTVPWKLESRNLIFYNENKLVSGTQNTNGWGSLTTSDGIASNVVTSVVMDLDGEIWAGLSFGVIIISDTRNPKSFRTAFSLREQVVQTIAVDGINNKWIGTKEGVFVLNPDGTQLLNSYSIFSTNKRLLNNDIRSIAIDQKRGIVYFGTEQGLSSFGIEPIQPFSSYSKLEIGPNPFILPTDQKLIIRNLVANSSIKILTVSGSVVKQFNAQGGGRAFWDGRDNNNELVSSGIYFIVAYAENGKQTVTGKVAVIRR